MADCSRQFKLDDQSLEHKDHVRRFLWRWCSRADGLSRKDHQKLSRKLPAIEDMQTVDEYKEYISLTYDSESDEEQES